MFLLLLLLLSLDPYTSSQIFIYLFFEGTTPYSIFFAKMMGAIQKIKNQVTGIDDEPTLT